MVITGVRLAVIPPVGTGVDVANFWMPLVLVRVYVGTNIDVDVAVFMDVLVRVGIVLGSTILWNSDLNLRAPSLFGLIARVLFASVPQVSYSKANDYILNRFLPP